MTGESVSDTSGGGCHGLHGGDQHVRSAKHHRASWPRFL